MEYELDGMMGFDKMDLYYEVHMAGIDGECFNYSVYFEDGCSDAKLEETKKAVDEFVIPNEDEDIYMGYIDVSQNDDNVNIYLDLGNVEPEDEDIAIKGILRALNKVSGIKSVIINEDCDLDF